jgi:hypothetical protein
MVRDAADVTDREATTPWGHGCWPAHDPRDEGEVDLSRTVGAYSGVYRDAYNFIASQSELRVCARRIMEGIYEDVFGRSDRDAHAPNFVRKALRLRLSSLVLRPLAGSSRCRGPYREPYHSFPVSNESHQGRSNLFRAPQPIASIASSFPNRYFLE